MESLLYRLIEENDVSWIPLGTSLQKQRDDEDRGINAQHDSEKVNSWLESEVDRLRAENERLKKEVENAQSNALVVATPAVNGTPSMQRRVIGLAGAEMGIEQAPSQARTVLQRRNSIGSPLRRSSSSAGPTRRSISREQVLQRRMSGSSGSRPLGSPQGNIDIGINVSAITAAARRPGTASPARNVPKLPLQSLGLSESRAREKEGVDSSDEGGDDIDEV